MLLYSSKFLLRAAVRAAALALAYNISLNHGFDLSRVGPSLNVLWPYIGMFVLIGFMVDLLGHAGRLTWRFVSIHDAIVITRDAIICAIAFLVAVFVVDRAELLPRSTLPIAWLADIVLFMSMLLARRAIHDKAFGPALLPFLAQFTKPDGRRPAMLVGGIGSADSFLKDSAGTSLHDFRPVGLISVEAVEVGRNIRGVRVIDALESAKGALERFADSHPDGALIFLDAAATAADINAETLGYMRSRGVKFFRRPRLVELGGAVQSASLQELQIEELLSRPPVQLETEQIDALVSGARVLITGAGGSIGSEICRQVAALGCAHLSMLDSSEFALFKIDQEIDERFGTLSKTSIICDIRNQSALNRCVERERPDIVFHAAALKHVPLMEAHPSECAATNIVGTWNVSEAARLFAAKHMVFISTDKAVDPSNVMGATKRLAESVVRTQQRSGSNTRFSVVRFGNVLGSAGSVVPTFLAQIARGGPVTVTHPDVERYFMTIPEAVQLVLHATATCAVKNDPQSGLFVLDMGEPVKIVELAQRLIDISDKLDGKAVAIQFTGLRPGEKLTEHLVDSTEEICSATLGVFEVRDKNANRTLNEADVSAFRDLANTGDDDKVRGKIFEMLGAVRGVN